MKRIIFTLGIALPFSLQAAAQGGSTARRQYGCDSVLLSQSRSGDCIVSRYRVKDSGGKRAAFPVYYAINLSDIADAYSGNSARLSDMGSFAGSSDSLVRISSVSVAGYASPDGRAKSNAALAARRADALKRYVENNYRPACGVAVASRVMTWQECIPFVENSSISERGEVLRILGSGYAEAEKERRLRRMPAAWEYLKTEVLPRMRYAEASFGYTQDRIVDRRSAVGRPRHTERRQPAAAAVIADEESGIIIDLQPDDECCDDRGVGRR